MFTQFQPVIMVVAKGRERKEDFGLDGEKIKKVERFVYLGSLSNIKGNGTRNPEAAGDGLGSSVEHGVDMEEQRYEFGTQIEVHLIRATAFPIAIYGCQSWTMTSGDKKRVGAFELWCYRRLRRVSWMESRANKWMLEKIGSVLTLRKSMSEKKVRFFVLLRFSERYGENTDAREDGRQADKE